MIETGDYINPSFNYNPRFNKPPLSYWVVAVSYHIFGISEWSERATMALAACGLIFAVFVMGRAIFNTQAGFWAAIVLATMPRFLMHSRRIVVDVYLTLFMGLTLTFFVLSEARPQRRKLWLALMYVSVGLGLITKGPIAAALPAISFFLYLLVHRHLGRIRAMMLPVGFLIVSAIVLPWYVAIYKQHGWHYIASFILKENLSRYTEEGWGPRRHFFYVTSFFGDLFPWSLLAALAIVLIAIKKYGPQSEANTTGEGDESAALKIRLSRLLAFWITTIVVFFSFSRNQQDQYILPTYIAAAVLVGGLITFFTEQNQERLVQALSKGVFALVGLLMVLGGALLLYIVFSAPPEFTLAGLSVIGFTLLIVGACAILFVVLKQQRLIVFAFALALVVLNWAFVLALLPDFERYKPVRPLSEIIRAQAGPEAKVGYYKFASPSMVFYLRRPVFEYYFEEEMRKLFASNDEIYCIMRAEDYEAIKLKLPPTRIIASRPLFRARLNTILKGADLPQIVLITNKTQ